MDTNLSGSAGGSKWLALSILRAVFVVFLFSLAVPKLVILQAILIVIPVAILVVIIGIIIKSGKWRGL